MNTVPWPNTSDYLDFEAQPQAGKTGRWSVLSRRSGDVLAVVKWYGPWRQYCFFPAAGTIWNKGCLADVQSFIEWHMAARRGTP